MIICFPLPESDDCINLACLLLASQPQQHYSFKQKFVFEVSLKMEMKSLNHG